MKGIVFNLVEAAVSPTRGDDVWDRMHLLAAWHPQRERPSCMYRKRARGIAIHG